MSHLVNERMGKRQPMRWSAEGASSRFVAPSSTIGSKCSSASAAEVPTTNSSTTNRVLPPALIQSVRKNDTHDGQQYPMAKAFEQEITKLYEAREHEREARRLESSHLVQRPITLAAEDPAKIFPSHMSPHR
jgi:hypothetical protein